MNVRVVLLVCLVAVASANQVDEGSRLKRSVLSSLLLRASSTVALPDVQAVLRAAPSQSALQVNKVGCSANSSPLQLCSIPAAAARGATLALGPSEAETGLTANFAGDQQRLRAVRLAAAAAPGPQLQHPAEGQLQPHLPQLVRVRTDSHPRRHLLLPAWLDTLCEHPPQLCPVGFDASWAR